MEEMKNIVEELVVGRPRVNQRVKGEVFLINDEDGYALVTVPGVGMDAKIFLDHLLLTVKDGQKVSDLVKEGEEIEAVVTKYDPEHSILLISRKPILRNEALEEVKNSLQVGQTVKALAKELNKGGLVLEYKGVEIFVPNSLLDRKIVNKEQDVKDLELEVVVQDIKEQGRNLKVTGSRKPILQKIREEEQEKRNQEKQAFLDSVNEGDVLEGVVVKIDNLSALVKLHETVVGLLRISQVSHEKINKVADLLKLDQKVTVKVLAKEGNRLDLSLKALLETPFELYVKEHKVGDTVTGKVVNKLPIGIIVELSKGVSGLLHVSEYSWKLNDNFADYVKIDQELTLKIIKVDNKRQRISLSKKVLEENPWKNVTLRKNDIVTGKVLEVTNEHGLKVLVQGVEGYVRPQEIVVENGTIVENFAQGDEVELVVLKADKKAWDLELSQKSVKEKAAQKEYKQLLESQEEQDTGMTIGDLLEEEK